MALISEKLPVGFDVWGQDNAGNDLDDNLTVESHAQKELESKYKSLTRFSSSVPT